MGGCEPKGRYKLRVVDVEKDTAKDSSDMLKLTLAVLKDGNPGTKLYEYLIFSEKSFWKVEHFLKSCGEYAGDGVDVDSDELADDCIGWECEADLKVETYQGRDSNKVAAFVFDDEDDFTK